MEIMKLTEENRRFLLCSSKHEFSEQCPFSEKGVTIWECLYRILKFGNFSDFPFSLSYAVASDVSSHITGWCHCRGINSTISNRKQFQTSALCILLGAKLLLFTTVMTSSGDMAADVGCHHVTQRKRKVAEISKFENSIRAFSNCDTFFWEWTLFTEFMFWATQ